MIKCCIFVIFVLFFALSTEAFKVSYNSDNREKQELLTDIQFRKNIPFGLEKTLSFKLENHRHYDYDCDCGDSSFGCHYDENNKKVCHCLTNYAQNDATGQCQYCYCGPAANKCFFENNIQVCDCKDKYFQNKYNSCEKCSCGYGYTYSGCFYDVEEKKTVCHCNSYYSQNDKTMKCEYCYCGMHSNKCTFENGKKVCSCKEKYSQDKYDSCTECDCGENSKRCQLLYSKFCTCIDGYIDKGGTCKKECDCGEMATSCRLTYDKYTRCTCRHPYVAEITRWEQHEYCKLPSVHGWRIATYIESVVFALIIIICITTIFCKRASS